MYSISSMVKFCLIAAVVAYAVLFFMFFDLKKIFRQRGAELAPNYEFKLCIMSRIKNAANFLPQWIEFHRLAGVDHFFLTNDCSEDNDKMTFWANFYSRRGYVSYWRNQTFNNCTKQQIVGRTIGSAPQLDFLLGQAKARCEWITVIDPDEYLFPVKEDKHFRMYREGREEKESLSLKQYITRRITPVFRLPWYVTSNQGHEKPPPGLIIDEYPDGHFQPEIIIKSLIKSVYIKRWNDSHFPTEYEAFAPNISRVTMSMFVMDFRYRVSEVQVFKHNSHICVKPKGDLLVKHFMVLSWEDFSSTRGNRLRNSEGNVDGWSSNTRATWEAWNVSSPCPQLGVRYRKIASKYMYESMQQNLAEYRGKHKTYPGLQKDLKAMFRGEKLLPLP